MIYKKIEKGFFSASICILLHGVKGRLPDKIFVLIGLARRQYDSVNARCCQVAMAGPNPMIRDLCHLAIGETL